ncbi:MAG TPA: hypothetical protein VKB52_10020, partial [Rhodanobacteraceae bacterium]|nr:hypothetical protein [Rhodanobacteraceae bacterium]
VALCNASGHRGGTRFSALVRAPGADYARSTMCGSGTELTEWRDSALRFEGALNECVLGLSRAVRLLTIAVFARGHVLLEGNVGVGKTTLLRAA